MGNGINRPGGLSPLDYRKWVAILDPEWGTILGRKALPYPFGRGVIWLGNREVLVWEVIHK